ncbi:hypothetical protein [Pandoraea terrae]|nr:hypothetical protein [Pandoraea terrae]
MQKDSRQSFEELADFDLELGSATSSLYRNGRQQVKLTVKIRAIDVNGNDLALSDAERKSLHLVQYKGSAELPQEWVSSTTYDGYEYFPASERRAARDGAPRDTEYFDFYVSSTASSPMQVAAQITRDDGVIIRTNGTTSHPDKYPHKHDSSVTLTPVTPPNYPLDHYHLVKERVQGDAGEWNPTFIDNHYLSLNDNRGQVIDFRAAGMTMNPAGMVQWHDKVVTETHVSYVGYGQPGEAQAYFNPEIYLENHTPDPTVLRPKPGQCTIILVARADIRYHNDSANRHNGPCLIHVEDVYGNEHKLRVTFASTTNRFDLTLSKA